VSDGDRRGDPLAEYRRKRDFGTTPEPAAQEQVEPTDDAADGGRFVIQQHDATRLHWDLRLEANGVLWSWALPRGLPWDPNRNHLAVHTEDHPIEYLTFEGDIPEGTYGAGHMTVWDQGRYELLSRKNDKLVVRLYGSKAQGRYSLFATRGDRDWMIHRMDPPADPDRRWPPEFVAPMSAAPGDPQEGDDWAWELRLSGLRVMTTLLPGAVRIHDATGAEVSERFADVRRLGRATGSVEAVLDGVIVAQPEHLERRMTLRPMSARQSSESAPVELVVFDLVWLEGHPCWDRPWDERRAELEGLAIDGPAWSTAAVHLGEGPLFAEVATEHGMSGVVGKRRDSLYRPGETTPDWLDVKLGRPS
jgi:bifunctional non-homologous end joining protein LigD